MFSFFDDGVQNAVPVDGGRADVRQQRESNAVSSAEVSQNLRGVVADYRQPDAVLPELFDATLQLDELRAAERLGRGMPAEPPRYRRR